MALTLPLAGEGTKRSLLFSYHLDESGLEAEENEIGAQAASRYDGCRETAVAFFAQ
jgi:hypothetical protein